MLLVAWLKLLLLNYKRTTTQTHWHRPVFVNSVVEKADLNTRRRVLNNSERLSKHGTSSTNVELRRTKVSLHKQQSNISTNLRTCFFLVPSVFSISLHACHTPASCSILFFLWVNSLKGIRHPSRFITATLWSGLALTCELAFSWRAWVRIQVEVSPWSNALLVQLLVVSDNHGGSKGCGFFVHWMECSREPSGPSEKD